MNLLIIFVFLRSLKKILLITSVSALLLLQGGCQQAENVEPVITTLEAQGIATNEAIMAGDLRDLGAFSTWVHGFVWSNQPGSNVATGNLVNLGTRTSGGVFSTTQQNLAAGSIYYFKAFVADPDFRTVFYGQELTFTTLP